MSTKSLDLRGQRFDRLFALRVVGSNYYGQLWYCLCSCGGRTIVVAARLRNGGTKSCGCLRGENRARMRAIFALKNSLFFSALKRSTGMAEGDALAVAVSDGLDTVDAKLDGLLECVEAKPR